MRLLLDTHAFVWWQADDPQLSPAARAAIAAPASQVFVSAATAWELAMKQAKGLVLLPGPLGPALARNRFTPLPIDVEAAERACALPWHHKDPWDRLLIAQAQGLGLTLVSRDAAFAPYGVPTLW